MYPFLPIGAISVVSIFSGLFARDALGVDLAKILLFGGVIVGCLNVLIAGIIKRLFCGCVLDTLTLPRVSVPETKPAFAPIDTSSQRDLIK